MHPASGNLHHAHLRIVVTAPTKVVDAAYFSAVLKVPRWRWSLVLHYLPVAVEEGKVMSAFEDALERDEGASGITAARWLTREREGKTVGLYVSELGSELILFQVISSY